MKKLSFLIVPDSFKDCMPAIDVGKNIEKGIRTVFKDADIDVVPMADGGEGTVESITNVTGGNIIPVKVKDALGRITDSFFGIIDNGKTAIIEMAAASGIEKLKQGERNAWVTSTYGTGQLIKAALDYGCSKIIVGLGGSATNDAGMGMAKALGIKFFDASGNELDEGGGSLGRLKEINISGLDKRIAHTKIIAATDVVSTLTGAEGASYVFGPQKGASHDMVKILDDNLIHFLSIAKNKLGINIKNIKGAGAAGGLGAGLYAFLNADIKPGFEIISTLIHLEDKIKSSNIVITAEGKVDEQTASGKTPAGVGRLALKHNKPVYLFAGNATCSTQKLYSYGITSILPITRKPVALDGALENAPVWLQKSAEELCRIIQSAQKI